MPRIDEAIEPTVEGAAASAVTALAEDIEQLCYRQEAQGIPAATVKALHKAYRVLKPIVEYYHGDDSPLVWAAPDWRFKKEQKK
jgi:hypothetical protein